MIIFSHWQSICWRRYLWSHLLVGFVAAGVSLSTDVNINTSQSVSPSIFVNIRVSQTKRKHIAKLIFVVLHQARYFYLQFHYITFQSLLNLFSCSPQQVFINIQQSLTLWIIKSLGIRAGPVFAYSINGRVF